MSCSGDSQRKETSRFPLANVSIISLKGKQDKPRLVRLAVSHRVWWKPVKNGVDDVPESLYDFRGWNSLEISRLPVNAVWQRIDEDQSTIPAVVETVYADNKEGPGLIVPGKVHGPVRRHRRNSDVKVLIVACGDLERDKWVKELRVRVAPWQLLQRHARHLALSTLPEDSLQAATRELRALFLRDVHTESRTKLTVFQSLSNVDDESATGSQPKSATYLSEKMQKVDWIEKLNGQLVSVVGLITKGVKMEGGRSNTQGVANTPSMVDDWTKLIPGGFGTLFHLVLLGARLAASCAEAGRGRRELPDLLIRVMDLLHCVTESVVPVLNSSVDLTKSEEILEANVFEVLVCALDVIGEIEEHLMRSGTGQTIAAPTVKKIEAEVNDLRQRVVPVVLTKKILQNERKTPRPYEALLPRPKLSPYFVGRKAELQKLYQIVVEHGSAVVSQFGGVGKTQFMVAFAEKMEIENLVPGGSFWVVAEGKESQVLESLSNFAEKLLNVVISEVDRRNPSLVVSAVRQSLSQRRGRWLLCLDNVDDADDAEVSGILDSISEMADPVKKNGWIVVTTRHGRSKIWDRMKEEQMITLSLLTEGDAMCLLWRMVKTITINDASDDSVERMIDIWKAEDKNEYCALRILSGNNCSRSLGGLSLALVQAGTFIRSDGCKFSEYLEMYTEANEREDLEDLLQASEEFAPLRIDQRSILSTWKISVDRLKESALRLLRALSLLGDSPMSEDLIQTALSDIEGKKVSKMKYRRTVTKELIHGTSLLQSVEIGSSNIFYIHRLIRMFMVLDLKTKPEEWGCSMYTAMFTVHKCLGNVLRHGKCSFSKIPEQIGQEYRFYLPHTVSIVNSTAFSNRIDDKKAPMLIDLLKFNCESLLFLGRVFESAMSSQKLLEVMETRNHHGEYDGDILHALSVTAEAFRNAGKNEEAYSKLQKGLSILKASHGKNEGSSSFANVYVNLGLVLQSQGKYVEAEKVYEKSLSIYKALLQSDKARVNIAKLYSSLGSIYNERGETEKAESMLKMSLNICNALAGDNVNDFRIANAANSLAVVHLAQGKIKDAEKLWKKALKIYRSVYGESSLHLNIAQAQSNLGVIYHEQGKVNDAKLMWEESLNSYRTILGPNASHISIAAVHLNLGLVYHEIGMIHEGEEALKKCLGMMRSMWGRNAENSRVAGLMNNLGLVLRDRGKIDEAACTWGEALEIFEKIYGKDKNHLDIAMVLMNMGTVRREQGKLDEALSILERSLRMYQEILGKEMKLANVALVLSNLGLVLCDLENYVESERRLKESLEMYGEIYGENVVHVNIALGFVNLGMVCMKQGSIDKAEDAWEKSLSMFMSVYGTNSNHTNIAMTLNNLGDVYRIKGKYSKAKSVWKRCLEMFQQHYGVETSHRAIALVLFNEGLVFHHQGKNDDALQKWKESVDMLYDLYGDEAVDGDTARIYLYFGNLSIEVGNYPVARNSLEKALSMYRALHTDGTCRDNIAQTLYALGITYVKQDELERAKAILQECVLMFEEIEGTGSSNPYFASVIANLGNVHRDLGEWKEAEKRYRTCTAMYIAHFGEETQDEDLVETFASLGNVLEAQGKLKEAKVMFEECMKHYGEGEDEDLKAFVENARSSVYRIEVLTSQDGN